MTAPMASDERNWRELATRAIVVAGAAAIPLVFVRDAADAFRFPKELVLRGEAILLVAVTLAALILGAPLPRLNWRDRSVALPLIALAAFAILTIASTKAELSAAALAAAAATFVVFLATATVRADWMLVGVPLAAAAVNAALVVAEEARVWMPFGVRSDVPYHLQCNALVGNPNEVGGYLGAATLACVAVLCTRAERVWKLTAVVLAAGLIASRTLTAIVAFAAAALVMLALLSLRRAIRVAVVAAVAIAIVVALVAPLRERAANMVRWMKSGDMNALFTDRLTPFAAAWSMFVDHPLTGVGPNAFAWHYYDYKIRAEMQHPSLRRAYNRGVNYGEVHSDHLQALAEGGVVGYGVFAAVLVGLGSLSFRKDVPRFARCLALPLAVYWIVLSLAQFPLETTVVRSVLIHFAALAVAWRDA
jgi:O-antigen ligase